MLGKCDFHSSKFVFCIFFSFFSLCPLAKLSKQVPPPLPHLLIFSSILSSSAVRFHLRVLGGRGNRVPSKLPNIHFETRPPPSLHPKNIFISSVFTPLLLHSFIFFSLFFFLLIRMIFSPLTRQACNISCSLSQFWPKHP